MKKLYRLEAITLLSKKNPEWIHKDIFRLLNKADIWNLAYENIKTRKRLLNEVEEKNDKSLQFLLQELRKSVYEEKYKFLSSKSNKTIEDNKTKKIQNLDVFNSEITQEVIKIILKAIYDPMFSEIRSGFCKRVGNHNTLNYIEKNFRSVDWIISPIKTEKYTKIDSEIIIKIIEKRIKDSRFIRLIKKFLKSKAVEKKYIFFSNYYSCQYGELFLFLVDVYYYEFDNYIDKFLVKTTSCNLLEEEALTKKKVDFIEKTIASEYKIKYARYLDEWVIGISYKKNVAIYIKNTVTLFFSELTKNSFNPIKIDIKDIRKGNVLFLGYYIFLSKSLESKSKNKDNKIKSFEKLSKLKFDVPVKILLKEYIKKGYLKQTATTIRPISKTSLVILDDYVIVKHYNTLWSKFWKYYSGCTKRRRLQYFHHLFHISCAMTLGHKHRLSRKEIFNKYGNNLEINTGEKKSRISFEYKTSWSINESSWILGKNFCIPIN